MSGAPAAATRDGIKWRSLIALLAIYIAVWRDWNWVWGVLFLIWTVPSFYSGRTFLVEDVERGDDPILFWTILVTWLVLSLALIAMDLALFIGD